MDYLEFENYIKENKNEENIFNMEKYMRNKFNFLGIKTPLRRKLYKEYFKSLDENKIIRWDFVDYLWNLEEREFQYIACDYLNDRKKLLEFNDLEKIKKLVIKKSWWDSVDNLQGLIREISLKNDIKNEILKWSIDENFWVRRLSIIYQLGLKENTDVIILEKVILNNVESEEFFINKAIGWALRDYSKTNKKFVSSFLEKNNNLLAKLSIREASKYLK